MEHHQHIQHVQPDKVDMASQSPMIHAWNYQGLKLLVCQNAGSIAFAMPAASGSARAASYGATP